LATGGLWTGGENDPARRADNQDAPRLPREQLQPTVQPGPL